MACLRPEMVFTRQRQLPPSQRPMLIKSKSKFGPYFSTKYSVAKLRASNNKTPTLGGGRGAGRCNSGWRQGFPES